LIHGHITGWVLALILFVVALFLLKSGKEKGAKIVKMILRVLYVLIFATGLGLLFTVYKIDVWYILKAVVGLWVIGNLSILDSVYHRMGASIIFRLRKIADVIFKSIILKLS
jgi:hypothetical protein